MKDIVKKAHLESKFHIESSATSTEEIGNSVYPPVKRLLAEHGIRCDGKYARQMTLEDYQNYDYIIAMDYNNLRNIDKIIGSDTENKVHLLLDYTGKGGSVADPWYTRNFQATWNDINQGCQALFDELTFNNA